MSSLRLSPTSDGRLLLGGHRLTAVAVVVLAVLSLASNVITQEELDGGWQEYAVVRRSVSTLLNAGTVWAGLAVLAGRQSTRWWTAALAGVLAAEAALVLHYALGRVLGIFPQGIWASNLPWFVMAVVACAPLGVVGHLSRRTGHLGLLAAMTVPVGAVLEPFWRGWFTDQSPVRWPQAWAVHVTGSVLLVAGIAGCVVVLRRRWASRRQR